MDGKDEKEAGGKDGQEVARVRRERDVSGYERDGRALGPHATVRAVGAKGTDRAH